MNLIRFGYDKNPELHQRGYARSDWTSKLLKTAAASAGRLLPRVVIAAPTCRWRKRSTFYWPTNEANLQ